MLAAEMGTDLRQGRKKLRVLTWCSCSSCCVTLVLEGDTSKADPDPGGINGRTLMDCEGAAGTF